MNESAPDGSALCLSCGLCCDGTLFKGAQTASDEFPRLRELGLPVFESHPGKFKFKLPCAMFDGKCSIYEQGRPRICGVFECRLLENHLAGRIGLDDAKQLVQRAYAMRNELIPLLPSPRPGTPAIRDVKFQMSTLSRLSVEERQQHLEFLMKAAQYVMFLSSNFLHPWQTELAAHILPDSPEQETK